MGASAGVLEVVSEEAVPQLVFEFVARLMLLFQIGFRWVKPKQASCSLRVVLCVL